MNGVVPASRRVARPTRSSQRTGPDPTFMEGLWANALAPDVSDYAAARKSEAMDTANAELVADLRRQGIDSDRYSQRGFMTGFRTVYDEDAIWSGIAAARRRNPKAFAALPATADEYRARIAASIDADYADTLGTAERAGTVPSLLGQLWSGAAQPESVATLPLAIGKAKTVGEAVLQGALLEARVEAIQQPTRALEKATRGQDYTTAEGLTNIAIAGTAGGLLAGGGKAIELKGMPALADVREAAIAKVWDRLPEAVQRKWGGAAKMNGEALADVVEATIGRDRMSADELAAVTVLRRDADVAGANPFVPNGAGVTAHADRLAKSMSAILADVPTVSTRPATIAGARGSTSLTPPRRSAGGTAIDTGIVAFFQSKGYSAGQARGIAAGIAAESRNSHGIINPDSGAYGLGQWLGTRKKELFRRYGPKPTREQQLEYLHWELSGGDHGGAAVRGARDEATALDAYIRRFMRPAKGAETSGDLDRGMAALGRAGEAPPASVEPDIDANGRMAELDAEAARLDGEANALAAAAPAADPVEAAIARIDTPDAPVLDAPSPMPELRPEVARAAGIAPAFAGRTLPVRNRPSDVIEYLADRGGIRDDAGHDLRHGRGWGEVKPFRSGRLVRKAGMSVDDAGELLHEAGFFVDRPTEAEVLDMVDRAVNGGEKIYALTEADVMAARSETRSQAKWGDEELEYRRDEVRQELAEYADFLDDDLIDDIVTARLSGSDEVPEPIQMLEELLAERYDSLRVRANEDAGDATDAWRNEFEHHTDEGLVEGARADDADGSGQDAVGAPARGSNPDRWAGGQAGEPSALSARAFDDPDAIAAREQADSIEHDLRAAVASAAPRVIGPLPLRGVAPAMMGKDGRIYSGPIRTQHFSVVTEELRAIGVTGSGFVDPDGNFLNRVEALQYVNANGEKIKPSENMEGELDALDYAEQSRLVAARPSVDPAIAERQRQQAALKAASPLQPSADQESTIGLGLFDATDQFRLNVDAADRGIADVLADLDSEDAAIATVRACLNPGAPQ